MSTYTPPLQEIMFTLTELAGLEEIAALPGFEDASPDMVAAILEEAGKIASNVLAPINHTGDEQGSHLKDGKVTTPDGWQAAYDIFSENGWNGLAFDPAFGGQGLPHLLATVVDDLMNAGSIAFTLCPMLTHGAMNTIHAHASDALKQTYLEKMVSGEWTGTMNLTEPQAGSDLSAIKSRAVADGEHYLITGQKIFITYGDHDLTENIIHLVLARLPDAPAGVKGISLFIVPKILVDENGNIGDANDVQCVSLEHKLGIHGSPTAVMSFGDNGGATGYLVGNEHEGLRYMFTMMNLARLSVGVEGIAISERAYQQAREYARERVQSTPLGSEPGDAATIIKHPDIRRMLMTMKSQIEAARAVAYLCSAAYDHSHKNPDKDERLKHKKLHDLLTPIVKGHSTELANELTSLNIQIHGGMGYIEETGAAQHYRDARITAIYEGTTGIQANDLIWRKLAHDKGEAMLSLIATMRGLDNKLASVSLEPVRTALTTAIDCLEQAGNWMLEQQDPRKSAAGAVPYLRLAGTVIGGWQMARAALASKEKLATDVENADFYRSKIITSTFYASNIMPQSTALLAAIKQGADYVLALDDEQF